MAYLKALWWKCDSCDRRATKEVIDRWNGSCGKFCSDCAKRKLREVLNYEKKESNA
jgi:hypothetical protein